MVVKKIGLLGGSFDPVHLAHIALAKNALTSLPLDEVQLIPAADPWQRESLVASAEQRVAMLRLAIGDSSGLHINTTEIDRGGKTYTIDTLEALPPDADYYWILGTDQLTNFCTWHRWEDIAGLVTLVVALRPGSDFQIPVLLAQHLARHKRDILTLPMTPSSISASEIRTRLAQERPVDKMLNADVHEYIRQHGLYETNASDARYS